MVWRNRKDSREGKEWGNSGNQQLNEWPFDRIIKILMYKARLKGIHVVKKEENYTSQPHCS